MAKVQKAEKQTTIKKMGRVANIMDATLAVIFFGLAVKYGWWFWWVSAVFCTVTAITSPFEKFGNYMTRKMLTVKATR